MTGDLICDASDASDASLSPVQRVKQVDCHTDLSLSRFDAVTSFLTASILLLGVLVSVVFAMWLIRSSLPVVDIVKIDPSRPSTSLVGFEQEFQLPSVDEIETLLEPSLADKVDAISDAVSTVSAAPHTVVTRTMSASTNVGGNPDGNLTPGPREDVAIGRYKRWEIKFHTTDKLDYAKQLDFFKIELAAFGGGENVIESAFDLSTRPRRHINREPETEERLYFSWKHSNPLLNFDRQLLHAAGISTRGRNIIRFTPFQLETALAALEIEHCKRNGKEFPDDIAKTTFESIRTENGFKFQIANQRYRFAKDVSH